MSESEVTQILSRIEAGNAEAAKQLLPLVYEELRKLAAAKMSQENPGQTLQATALVHDAYLRLVGDASRTGGVFTFMTWMIWKRPCQILMNLCDSMQPTQAPMPCELVFGGDKENSTMR